MTLVERSCCIAAQPRHRIAVDPTAVLVEVLGTFLNHCRSIAVSPDAVIEVREEVYVERVIASPPRLRPESQVCVEVDDINAII